MSTYQIDDRQYAKAEQLGVKIHVSTNKRKKIDVHDANDCFILSIGAINHADRYSLEKKGMLMMDIIQHKERLLSRHKNDCSDKFFYLIHLLW
jgi:hypothetical protein